MVFKYLAALVHVVLLVFIITTEVTSLQCYQCTNCTTANKVKVTCALPNITTTTPQPVETTTYIETTTVIETTTAIETNNTATDAGNENVTDPPIANNETEVEQPNANDTASTNEIETLRVERSIDFYDDSEDCLCENGYCTCNQRVLRETNVTFVCVTDTISVNNVSMVHKGCAVELNTTANTCLLSGYSSTCKTCNYDLCNTGFTWKASLRLLIPVVLVSVIYM